MSENGDTADWRQISVTTSHGAMAEVVFEHFGAAAITELDTGESLTVELTADAQPAFERSKIVGMFPADAPIDAIRNELLETLGSAIRIEVDELSRRDWVDAWIAHHPPLHFGGRLWVAPHGARVCTHSHDDIIVRLDPGLAFGTGTHPSTSLCLTWLAHADLSGCRVLDYGCGSGILAIAAALLGAKQVCAVDIDDQAIRATRDNAADNGVADHITTPALDAIGSTAFDIVLANIVARPLMQLAPTLTTLTQTGGRLVLSGLLQRQAAAVQKAYGDGFVFDSPAQQDEWIRLDGVRNTAN